MSGVLRRFNEAGIAEFVRRIELLRTGGSASIDDAFVTDDLFTKPVVPEVRLERPVFKTKREAGAYLSERTRRARERHGDDDPGLWTWLSAWHWDAVCPVRENGARKVLHPLSYVYGHGLAMRKKQHLIFASTLLYETFPQSLVLLSGPASTLTQAVHEVYTRVWLMRIRGIGELLDILYWDRSQNAIKPGINGTSPRPGDLRNRLTTRVRQLEKTYDLVDLTADQLLNLLGDEFKAWTDGRTPTRSKSSTKPKSQRSLFEDA